MDIQQHIQTLIEDNDVMLFMKGTAASCPKGLRLRIVSVFPSILRGLMSTVGPHCGDTGEVSVGFSRIQ